MVLASRAALPTAVLLAPVVFTNIAFVPTAVLLDAVVVAVAAFTPIPTFEAPVVTCAKALRPTAVLFVPEVKSSKASKPKPVLLEALDRVPVPASWLISKLSLKLVAFDNIPTPLIVPVKDASPEESIDILTVPFWSNTKPRLLLLCLNVSPVSSIKISAA